MARPTRSSAWSPTLTSKSTVVSLATGLLVEAVTLHGFNPWESSLTPTNLPLRPPSPSPGIATLSISSSLTMVKTSPLLKAHSPPGTLARPKTSKSRGFLARIASSSHLRIRLRSLSTSSRSPRKMTESTNTKSPSMTVLSIWKFNSGSLTCPLKLMEFWVGLTNPILRTLLPSLASQCRLWAGKTSTKPLISFPPNAVLASFHQNRQRNKAPSKGMPSTFLHSTAPGDLLLAMALFAGSERTLAN
ncbi:hypothetical protein LINPERPRIM_LOCUS40987 [Linum perenne]